MQLVYLSPVPWASFSQRPHKFVEWFHGRTRGRVLWIAPYPTRLPTWQDLRRSRSAHDGLSGARPDWIEIVCPRSLPIEPLPLSGAINRLFWRHILARIAQFASQDETIVGIGKPSTLALNVVNRLHGKLSVYDAMDDFPAFYSGLSRVAMARRERLLLQRTAHVTTSSTFIKQRWASVRPDIQLIPNGLDADILPEPKVHASHQTQQVLGYVGTLGAWFDWDWVIALARARPDAVIKLVGPLFVPARQALPPNIELHPQCAHADALHAMREFDVGLIPFRRTVLTRSVDPIKYYEYRALGLPVMSTRFGEMALRGTEEGTFLSDDPRELPAQVDAALRYRADAHTIARFRSEHAWHARFEQIGLIP